MTQFSICGRIYAKFLQNRHAIQISYCANRKFQLCRPNYPRGSHRTNPQSSLIIDDTLAENNDLTWSTYVKKSSKNDSLEHYISTSFGHVRVDSQNLPKYHGQQDEYDKECEEALGNVNNALLHDLDSSKTHEVIGTSHEIHVPQISNVTPVSKSDADTQDEPFDRFKPTVINFDDHSNNILRSDNSLMTPDFNSPGHLHNKATIFDKSNNNSIDEYYFEAALKNTQDYSTVETELKENPGVKVTHDSLNDIDQQYFSQLNSSHVNQVDTTSVNGPTEMKQIQLKDVKTHKNDTLNFVDSQMFGGNECSGLKTTSTFAFPPKKKPKSKQKLSETKNTALDYVKKMRENFKFESPNSGQIFTKEQEIKRLGESLQKRIGRVVMQNNPQRSKNDDDSNPIESSIENTSGRVPFQFLPVDLESLTTVEVENIIKRSVLYDDNEIVAIHKPYGLQMFGESKRSRHSVESLLSCLLDSLNIESSEDWPGLMPVHRLDKNTTGILLCAKTKEMHNKLTNLFREQKIEKRYWAILNGTPDLDEAIIEIPLGNIEIKGRHRLTLRPDYTDSNITNKKIFKGHILPAVTGYSVLKRKGNAALVEAKPKTGFKHQIRAHLGLGLNTPILGDHKYSRLAEFGKPQKVHGDILHKLEVRKSRSRDLPICLHAKRILIPEIIQDRHIAIDCGLPHHFVKIMKKLGLKPTSHVS